MTYSFEAIGTQWSIEINDELTAHDEQILKKEIADRIEAFDKAYSRFRQDSLISKAATSGGTFTFPQDAKPLFTLYKSLYQITKGAFTPLIGNVLSDAGYDAKYTLKPGKLRKTEEWDEVFSFSHPVLTMKKPAILDFGAAGKGYLVDIIGGIIQKYGIANYCVDGSGDILYKSEKHNPLRVGLEHPEDPTKAIGVATLRSGSICGSAGNRRKWGEFTHIIDPHTQTSPKDTLAIWVIAETAILADALATCLSFVSADMLQNYYQFEYVMVKADYSLEKSADFPGEFFYN
jgi:thiamine biosynthesis lipoprotein